MKNLFSLGLIAVLLIVSNSNLNAQCGGDFTVDQALCKDISVSLDINSTAIISGADVDNGSSDLNGVSFSLDDSIFNCLQSQIPTLQNHSFDFEWGATGSSPGQFSVVSAIDVTEDGKIYVLDHGRSKVIVMDQDSSFLFEFGTFGGGAGQFTLPRDITVASNGDIYVVDNSRQRVLAFDSTGVFQFEFGTTGGGAGQFTDPFGITLDNLGNVYVTDLTRDKILVFTSAGGFLHEFGTSGVAVGDFQSPYRLIFDGNDRLYIADEGRSRVIVYRYDGTYLFEIGSNGFSYGQSGGARGVALDGMGNVYLMSNTRERVLVYDTSGVFQYEFGYSGTGYGQLDYPFDIDVLDSGKVFVVEGTWDKVKVYDPVFAHDRVVLTVTDGCGNIAQCNAAITLIDTIASEIYCHADTVIYTDGGLCTAVFSFDSLSISDTICSSYAQVSGSPSGSSYALGITTNTFVVSDAEGNTDTCSFNVTVLDTVNPVAVCQNITIYLDSSGNAVPDAYQVNSGSTDNCSIDTMYLDIANFSCSDTSSIHEVVLTVVDSSGNSDTCHAFVTVADNMPPTIVCHDTVAQIDANGYVVITKEMIYASSTDNCGVVEYQLQSDSATCSDISAGAITFTLIATDFAGNTSSCNASVTVIDTIADLQISCRADTVVSNDGARCVATLNYNMPTTNMDASCVSITQIAGLASGAEFPLGVTVNTFVATDLLGHTDTCSFSVTVIDNEAPMAVCGIAGISLDSSGTATLSVSQVNNGSSDNCGIDTMYLAKTVFNCSDLFSGESSMLIVVDHAGNADTCVGSLTIEDGVAPTVVCMDTTIYLNEFDSTGINVDYLNNGSYDNCTIDTMYVSKTSFDCNDFGPNTVYLIAQDIWGNKDSCAATVTVLDTSGLTISCRPDTTINADAGLCTALLNYGSPMASDAYCVTVTQIAGLPSGAAFPAGITTNTYVAVDANNNSDTCSFNVTVLDTIPPIITCPSDTQIQFFASSDPSVTGFPIAIDVCPIDTIYYNDSIVNFSAGSCPNLQTIYRQWIVIDDSGNSDTCAQVINVTDTIPPIAVCNDITVYLDNSGSASFTVNDVNGGSTDNYGIASISLSKTSVSCLNVDTNTAIIFDGLDDHIVVPHDNSLHAVSGVSLECWFKTQGDSSDMYLMSKTEGTGSYENYDLRMDADGKIRFSYSRGGANNENIATISSYNDNEWHHIAAVHSAVTGITFIMVDGLVTSSTTLTTGNLRLNSSPLYIGLRDTVNGGHFNGELDEVRIWNLARTQSEIIASMAACLTGNESGLNAYYNFEEGVGNASAIDNSSNSNNGTLTNMSLPGARNATLFNIACASSNVILSVTDSCGNVATCTANITIIDSIPPSITCIGDTTIYTDPGQCDATIALPLPDVQINCSQQLLGGEYALSFDGIDDQVTAPPAIPTGGEYTVSVWAKNNGPLNVYAHILSQGRKFYLGTDLTGNIRVGDDWLSTGVQYPTDGQWHEFTVVRTLLNTHLYIDGNLMASKGGPINAPIVWAGAPNNFKVGAQWGNDQFFNGDISEIRIWNSALSAGKIISYWNKALIGTEPNLYSYYHFTDGPGSSTLSDGQGNNPAGTLTNMDPASDWISFKLMNQMVTNDFTGNYNASATYPLGVTAVNYTVTDLSGNTSSCSFNVTVIDNELPSIICPPDTIVSLDSVMVVTGDIIAASLSVSKSAYDTSSQNHLVKVSSAEFYNLQATIPGAAFVGFPPSAYNNSTWSGNYTVTTNDPVSAIPADHVLLGFYVNSYTNNNLVGPRLISLSGGTGNVEVTYPNYGVDAGETYFVIKESDQYSNIATYLGDYHSNTMNSATLNGSYFYSSSDNVYLPYSYVSSYTPHIYGIYMHKDYISGTWNIDTTYVSGIDTSRTGIAITSDNCELASFEYSDSLITSGVCPFYQRIERSWISVDLNGNADTCVQIINIADSISPVAVCKDTVNVYVDESGIAYINGQDLDGGSYDNCDITSYSTRPATLSCDEIGIGTDVVLIVGDSSGNLDSCSSIVTVLDTIAPKFIESGTGIAYVSSISPTPFYYEGVNGNETAMDDVFGAGNWDHLYYESLDLNSLFTPATTFIYLEGGGSGTAMKSFFDNHRTKIEDWVFKGGSIFINNDHYYYGGGESTIDFGFGGVSTKYDIGYNYARVASLDNSHPIFVGPLTPVIASYYTFFSYYTYDDAVLSGTNASENLMRRTYDNEIVLAEKNWGSGHALFGTLRLAGYSGSQQSYFNPRPQTLNLHRNILHYGASFQNSNLGTSDTTIYTNNFECDATEYNYYAVADDNCELDTLICTPPSGSLFPVGTSTVICVATDIYGNSDSIAFDVTVINIDTNVVKCPPDIDIDLSQTSDTSLTGSAVACFTDSVWYSDVVVAGSGCVVQTIYRTWIAADNTGFSDTCVQVITRSDNTAPLVSCQDVILYLDSTGSAVLDPAVVGAGSTDDFGIASMTLNKSNFNCNDASDTTSVWQFSYAISEYGDNIDGKLEYPYGMALGNDGKVYVADYYQNVVEVFDQEANFLYNFGNSTEMGWATGIAINSNGDIYIANAYKTPADVAVYDSLGNYKFSFGTNGGAVGEFYSPFAITIDNNDRVYVTDESASKVLVFDENGIFLFEFGGTYGTGPGQLTYNYGICYDEFTSHLYLTDYYKDKIIVFDTTGTFLFEFGVAGSGNGEINLGWGITSDNNGKIYVTDYSQHNIIVYKTNGDFIEEFGSYPDLYYPVGVGIDGGGDVFILSRYNHNVAVYSAGISFQNVTLTVTDSCGNSSSCFSKVSILDTLPPVAICTDTTIYLDSLGNASLVSGPQKIYFTGTTSNQLWSADIRGIATPSLLHSGAASNPVGPDGIEYVPSMGNLYYGGGNNPEVRTVHLDTAGIPGTVANSTVPGGAEHYDVAIDPANNRYFYSASAQGLYRANLDGTGGATQISTSTGVSAVDYDPVSTRVYFNTGTEIKSVLWNGTDEKTLFDAADGVNDPKGITLDPYYEKIYWTNRGTDEIMGANLDGTGSPIVLYSGLTSLYAIDLDEKKQVLYWTQYGIADKIMYAKADGSATPSVLYSGNYGGIRGISLGIEQGQGNHFLASNSYDNCNVIKMTCLDKVEFTCADLGSNNVTISLSDEWNNLSECVSTVTVADTIPPVITCPNDTSIDCVGLANTAQYGYATATDNACIDTILYTDVVDSGQVIRTWVAYDLAGNTDTCVQILNILDDQAPVAICQDVTVYLDSNGTASITISDINNGSYDDCMLDSMSLSKTEFSCDEVNPEITGPPTFSHSIGNYGSGTGQMYSPNDVAVSDDGDICVADRSRYRVICYDSLGNFVWESAGYGGGSGQFYYPTSVEIDKKGNVYVVDQSGYKVTVFNKNGAVKFEIKTGYPELYGPSGIAIDDEGKLFVVNNYGDNVSVFDSTGLYLYSLGTYGGGPGQFYSPWAIDIDNSGNVYVTDYSRDKVVVFDNAGMFLHEFNTLGSYAYGIAVGPDGTIWVSDYYGIMRGFDQQGNVRTSFNSGSYYNYGIDVAADGSIYIARNYSAVLVFDPPVRSNNVTLTVWDKAGNSDQCIATVFIKDTIAPVLTDCPNDTLVFNDDGECSALVKYDLPKAKDNCSSYKVEELHFNSGGTGTSYSENSMQIETDQSLTTNVVLNCDVSGRGLRIYDYDSTLWTYSGGQPFTPLSVYICAPASSHLFISSRGETFIPSTTGMVSFPSTQGWTDILCMEWINTTSQVALDIDSFSFAPSAFHYELVTGIGSGGTFPVGTTTETYVLLDEGGNASDTCSFNITVVNTEPLTITCPPDITILLSQAAEPILTGYATSCFGEDSIWYVDSITSTGSGQCIVQVIERTWIAMDSTGVTDTCLQVISVTDDTYPVAMCADDMVLYLGDDGTIPLNVSMIDNGSYDNIGIASISIYPDTLTCKDIVDSLDVYRYEYSIGEAYQSGTGQYYYANALASDNKGKVYVGDYGNDKVLVFDQQGNFLFEFTYGSFQYIYGIDVDASGNIYVAEYYNGVLVFDSTGTYSHQIGSVGSGTGQYNYIQDVAVDDNNGNVYVPDRNTERVLVHDSAGNYLYDFGPLGVGAGSFGYITRIDFASDGLLYVSDYYNGVKAYSNGVFLSDLGVYGSGEGEYIQPYGVVIDSVGNFYVNTNDGASSKIVVYDPAGDFLYDISTVFDYVDIALSSNGTLFCGDWGKFDVYTKGLAGTFVTLTVTDVCGNVSTCKTKITVLDSICPEIVCPADINVDLSSGQCRTVVNYSLSFNDNNCFGASSIEDAVPEVLSGFYEAREFDGHLYYFSDHALTFESAKSLASSLGAQLVTINSNEENEFIRTNNGNYDLWIGMSDSLVADSFAWINGDALDYTNWYPGYPNTDGGNDDGVYMYYDGRWVDRYIGNSYRFVIEFDAGSPDLVYEQIAGLASGEEFPAGTTTNTFVVSDPRGKTDTCSFDVIVNDITAPTIVCPNDTIVFTNANSCEASVSLTSPVVYDDCMPFGNALDFDGDSDYVALPTIDSTWFRDEFTIEAWVYLRSYEYWSRLIDFGNGESSDNVLLALTNGTSGYPRFSTFRGGSQYALDANEQIPLNKWTHIAATASYYTDTYCYAKIYMDGNEIASGNVYNPYEVERTNCYIGRSNWSVDNYANAIIDELRIWNVGKSQAEIQNSMTKRLSGDESGLLMYYDFDQGVAGGNNIGEDTLVDKGPNGVDGTLYDFHLNADTSNWVSNNATNYTVTNSYTGGANASGTYPIGSTYVTYFAEDPSGNRDSCTFRVKVVNTNPFEIYCPPTVSIQYGDTANPNITGYAHTCYSDTLWYYDTYTWFGADSCPVLQEIQRHWVGMDELGVRDTCIQIINVQDNTPPEAACKNAIVYLNQNGEASITVSDIENGSTDNYGIDSLWLDRYNFSCSDVNADLSPDTILGYVFDHEWGVYGDSAGQFYGGYYMDMEISSSGKLYIANGYYGNRTYAISVFDLSENLLFEFGKIDTGVGNLSYVEDLALHNGRVYVLCDGYGNNQSISDKVVVFDTLGNFLYEFDTRSGGHAGFAYNTWQNGIAVDGSGVIYITDGDVRKVFVYSNSGAYQYSFGPGVSGYGITGGWGTNYGAITYHDGKIYLNDYYNGVQVYAKNGTYLYEMGEYNNYSGSSVEFDAAGKMFVSNYDHIAVYDSSEVKLFEFGCFGFNSPGCSYYADPDIETFDGNVYIISRYRTKVMVYKEGDQVITNGNVTLFVRDSCGNVSSCEAQVFVLDTIAPQVTCPNDTIVNIDAPNCYAIVNYEPPSIVDNCHDIPSPSLTMEFETDYAAGSNLSYTENGMTISTVSGNSYDRLGTYSCFEGNAYATYAYCYNSCTYDWIKEFTYLDGQAFTPDSVYICNLYNVQLFISSKGDTITPTSNGYLVFPNTDEWSNITSITWDRLNTYSNGYIQIDNFTFTPDTIRNSVELLSGLGSGAQFPPGVTTEVYKITDAYGNSDTCSFTVTVIPVAPIGDIAAHAICTGSDVSFDLNDLITNDTATLVSPLSFLWKATSIGPSITGASTTWQGGSTINDVLTNLSAVAQTVVYTVRPANSLGCEGDSLTVTVTVNPVPIVVLSPQGDNILCDGETRIVSASASGANFPFTYNWTVNSATNVSMTYNDSTLQGPSLTVDLVDSTIAGTLTLEVIATDSVGCESAPALHAFNVVPLPVITLTDPPDITINSGVQYNSTVGSPAGGVYSGTGITDGGNGSSCSFDPIVAGVGTHIITYTYTDVNGCTNSATQDITVYDSQPVATCSMTSGETCGGDADGSASVSVIDGVTPYTYSWNTMPPQTTTTATGLAAGSYTVVVTDSIGSVDSCMVTVPLMDTLNAIACYSNGILCSRDTLKLYENGGHASSWTWTGPNSFYSTAQNPTYTFTTSLASGWYYVTTTNVNGCSYTDSVSVTIHDGPRATCNVDQPIYCGLGNDGQATVVGSDGTAPYTYLWSDGQTTATANSLGAGFYSVTVTDANGCTDACGLTIGVLTTMTTTTSRKNISCKNGNDGTASIGVSQGTPPYTYSWNTAPVQTNSTATGLTAGTYDVTVTDANACTTSTSITVPEPSKLITFAIPNHPSSPGSNDGSINQLVTGGIAPYSHSWITGSTNEDVNGLGAGVYFCTTADRNGCAVILLITLYDPPPKPTIDGFEPEVSIDVNRLMVYPNPTDGLVNLSFDVVSDRKYQIQLINSIGEIVAVREVSYPTSGWMTESFNMEEWSVGMYTMLIRSEVDNVRKRIILTK